MTEAYDHILNNGDRETIAEPIGKAVYGYLEEDKQVEISGSLEDPDVEWIRA
jgi:hypothetical protein